MFPGTFLYSLVKIGSVTANIWCWVGVFSLSQSQAKQKLAGIPTFTLMKGSCHRGVQRSHISIVNIFPATKYQGIILIILIICKVSLSRLTAAITDWRSLSQNHLIGDGDGFHEHFRKKKLIWRQGCCIDQTW